MERRMIADVNEELTVLMARLFRANNYVGTLCDAPESLINSKFGSQEQLEQMIEKAYRNSWPWQCEIKRIPNYLLLGNENDGLYLIFLVCDAFDHMIKFDKAFNQIAISEGHQGSNLRHCNFVLGCRLAEEARVYPETDMVLGLIRHSIFECEI